MSARFLNQISILSFVRRLKGQLYWYKKFYEHVDRAIRPKDHPSSTANHDTNLLKLDAFGNMDCAAAHNLSLVCYIGCVFVAEAAVGKSFESFDSLMLSGRVAQALKLNPPALKGRKILLGVKGKNSTSLEGQKLNKMYLAGQKSFYDTDSPSILIIPCLPFQQVMDWATEDTTAIPYDVVVLTFSDKGRRAAGTVLQMTPRQCTLRELEDARVLLEIFVKGVAGCLKTKKVKGSFSTDELEKNITIRRWSGLVDEIINGNVRIGVPTNVHVNGEVHIGKARFSKGNSLPDPWLLLVKAATNYSAF